LAKYFAISTLLVVFNSIHFVVVVVLPVHTVARTRDLII